MGNLLRRLARPRSPLALAGMSVSIVVLGTGTFTAIAATSSSSSSTPRARAAGHFDLSAGEVNHLVRVVLAHHGLLNLRLPQQIAGPAGPQGPAGPAGPQGPAGQQGPAGISGQTRWGNVRVASGAADVLLAQVGSLQFWAHCTGAGRAQTLKKTTTNGNSLEDEDKGSLNGTFNVGSVATGDQDSDEAGFFRDNTTGLTVQYLAYGFDAGNADPSQCEFQGTATQTS